MKIFADSHTIYFMRNFGEELAYWYLRLNGFFPINDFVLHSSDLDGSQNADTDVIGIRNPFTVEEIGMAGYTDICDKLSAFEPNINQKTVVVISEVKSGENRKPIKLSDADRLKYVIKRIGLFNGDEIDTITNSLSQNNSYSNSDKRLTILKIIFAQIEYEDSKFHFLSLNDIEGYIIKKFTKYSDEKTPARLLFPSTLMQYMIWKIRERTN